ncbi:MAG: sporulation initiation factor Spo0A C-terminal domain-containing protein [Clostridia bacterium]|nr:sporulation initiation factor Spo0A C-terminal domain-containing protein [Clostridia bacterium]
MNYELLQRREPTLEEKVYEILKNLRVPIGSKGHKYLLDAIQTAVREPETLSSINKKLFPRIADAYNTTVACVESAIRSAITRAWGNGDPEIQKQHFGHTVPFGSGRPSDAEFIAIIANMPEMRKFK